MKRDNDPVVFWTYVAAALQSVAAHGVGAGALLLLESPQPPIEAVLATLLNDLDAISDEVVLVLEDYHVIDARDVQDGMAPPAGAPTPTHPRRDRSPGRPGVAAGAPARA